MRHLENGTMLLSPKIKSYFLTVPNLNINRRTIENNRESITDIGWYFNNIIQKFKERECPVDYIKFEEYVD